jgi:hypothetical protein
MKNNPVFIHSLFRCGSTYFWSKFRENEDYFCYYEPLHHFLLEIDFDYENKFEKEDFLKRENAIQIKHYLDEYKYLIDKHNSGIPHFKKSFIFDQYCNIYPNPELKKYIDFLLINTGNRRPVLQFNRTGFRTSWFKHNFPEALNIYLVRNPRDQWESYKRKEKKGRGIFIVMDLMISSLNLSNKYFHTLSQYIPLIKYQNNDFHRERIFYDTIKDAYSNEEKYFIFYYIWLYALIENVLHADVLVDMNLLYKNSVYKNEIIKKLKNYCIEKIDFDDVDIHEYNEFSLKPRFANDVECKVQEILLRSGLCKEVDYFFEKLSKKEHSHLGLSKNKLSSIQGQFQLENINTDKINVRKKEIIYYLADKSVSFKNEAIKSTNEVRYLNNHYPKLLKIKENIIKSKEKQIKLNERQINDLYNSFTFKVGNFILYPFKIIRRMIKKNLNKTNV